MAKNRINKLRKAQNLKLKDLVELLAEKGIKVNESQLSKFEKGTTPRSENIWEALSEIFEVSPAYVMGYGIDEEEVIDLFNNLNSQAKILSDEYKKDTGKTKNPTIKELRQYVKDNQERKINEDIKQLKNISYNLNEINRKKLIEYAKDLSKLQNFEKEKAEDKK